MSKKAKKTAAAPATKSFSFGQTKFVIPKTVTTPAVESALKKIFTSGGKVEKIKVGKTWVDIAELATRQKEAVTRATIEPPGIPAESPRLPAAMAEAARTASQSALPRVKDVVPAALKPQSLGIQPAMDPRLQVACARRRMGMRSRGISSATAEEVAVIAKVSDVTQWEALSEVRVGTTLGSTEDGATLVTARIPVTRVEAVRAQPFVQSLKASQPVRKSLTATISETGCKTTSYPQGTAPDSGAGVVVGIVDFGGDFAHQNFRNANGSTRLLAIWDQGGSANASSPYGYGRLYSRPEINAALTGGGNPYHRLGYGPPPGDPAHGTHVMDIAAGNGRGTGAPGCAPKADLIFVEVAASDIAWSGSDALRQSFGDSVQMLEAVKFIFEQAGARPCVINLSLGTNGGPHDGRTLVEQGIDTLIRAQTNRAVVIAASNSYSDGIHAAGTVPAGGSFDLVWETDAPQFERELEIWMPGSTRVAAEIIAPDGTSLGTVEPGANLALADGGQLAIYASSRLDDPNNHDNSIGVYVAGGVDGGTWTVRLHSRNAKAGPFHAWVEREDRGQSHFTQPLDNSHTIGSISCGRESIAVGSFDAHKTSRPISYFSSAGPTRDGRQKPEVSAPGHAVIAAASRTGTGTTNMSGTSMAAPAVTGLVALLLAEAHRQNVALNSAQIRNALIQTARRNPPAGSGWTDRYGYGRVHIDALTLVAASHSPAPGSKPKRKPSGGGAKKKRKPRK